MITCEKCSKGRYDEQTTKFLRFYITADQEQRDANEAMGHAQWWVTSKSLFTRLLLTRDIWEPEDPTKIKTQRDLDKMFQKRKIRFDRCFSEVKRVDLKQKQEEIEAAEKLKEFLKKELG